MPHQFQRVFATIPPEQLEQKIRLKKSASATNVDLTILEGTKDYQFQEGNKPKGCHLACAFDHRSIWQRIVDENISSALIMSSDAAWDARIRSQLLGFCDAAQTLTNKSPDPSSIGKNMQPVFGPYGTDWDILWLGHCGSNGEAFDAPINDLTEIPHAKIWTAPDGRPLEAQYSSTDIRLISDKPVGDLCLSSYAVSYRGAVKLLSLVEDMRGLLDQYVKERCQDGDLKCVIQWPQILGQVGPASIAVQAIEELKTR